MKKRLFSKERFFRKGQGRLAYLLVLYPYSLTAAIPTASQQLIYLLRPIHSLQATFSQHITDQQGRLLQNTQGQFAFQRPYQFRWHIHSPSRQLLVADGQHIWFYDPVLKQVTRQAQSQLLLDTSPAMLFLTAPKDLSKHFNIQRLKSCARQYCFSLTPKAKEAVLSHLILKFSDNKPVEINMTDALGHHTHIRFYQAQANLLLKPAYFRFTVPPQVEQVEI